MATFITRRDRAGNVIGYRVRYNYRPKNIDGKPYDERDFAPSRYADAVALHESVGDHPVVVRGGKRIADVMAAYLASETYIEQEQSTRNDIEGCIRKHIVGGIGHLRHDRITSREVKAWHKALTVTGFSHLSKQQYLPGGTPIKQRTIAARPVKVPTANKVLRYAKAIMRWARVEELTNCRAFEEIKALPDRRPSTDRRKPPRAYTDDEKRRLIAACETLLERTVLETDWDSGLRRGELFALHWDQVRWKDHEIAVTRALNPDGSTKEPKTHERRTVPVFDDGMAALKAWGKHIAKTRGCKLADLAGLVFHDEHGEPLNAIWESRHAGSYRTRRPTTKPGTKGGAPTPVLSNGIRKRSGIHLELGHCRDTYAAELLATPGVGAEELKFAMGHETVETTLRHYAEWIAARRSQIAGLVRTARKARAGRA